MILRRSATRAQEFGGGCVGRVVRAGSPLVPPELVHRVPLLVPLLHLLPLERQPELEALARERLAG